jgi:hypothetical protein
MTDSAMIGGRFQRRYQHENILSILCRFARWDLSRKHDVFFGSDENEEDVLGFEVMDYGI